MDERPCPYWIANRSGLTCGQSMIPTDSIIAGEGGSSLTGLLARVSHTHASRNHPDAFPCRSTRGGGVVRSDPSFNPCTVCKD